MSTDLYIKIYTDEDVFGTVARALRDRGFDAVSTPEAGNLGLSDLEQLCHAVSQHRTILTFNVSDFIQLHTQFRENNQEHYGIIVCKRLHVSEIIKRMLLLLNGLLAEEMKNRLEFLTFWHI